jgi:hypothetical protein
LFCLFTAFLCRLPFFPHHQRKQSRPHTFAACTAHQELVFRSQPTIRPAHITDFVITRDRLSSRNHRSKISPHIPRPGKYPSRHYAISGDCMQMVKRTRECRKDCPHSWKWLDTNTTVASVKLRTSPVTRWSPYVIFTRSQRGWYAIFEPSPGGPYVIFGRSPLWRISE